MDKHRKRIRLSYNAPVVITFVLICLIAVVLNWITGGISNQLFFCTYRSSWLNPLTYIRLFTHVIGHADLEHFFGNMTLFLVIGPLLEEKYGSLNLLFVILTTALITGLLHGIFFPNQYLLGASGVVFAFILLSTFTNIKDEKVPITFILVAMIYMGQQVYDGIFLRDNVSNFAHIVGGLTGTGLGFVMYKYKMNRY